MTNLDSILKSRDTLWTKVCLVQSCDFSSSNVWVWEVDYKKAECQRIDAFELWCWRISRVPWTARRSNQSILKEISPEYSSEGLMLKVKLQSFGHLMQRTDSLKRPWCWKRLRAGGEGAIEDEMWLDGIMDSMDVSLSKLLELVLVCYSP